MYLKTQQKKRCKEKTPNIWMERKMINDTFLFSSIDFKQNSRIILTGRKHKRGRNMFAYK